MTEMTQNIPFCTERLKYKLNIPLLSTFGEPKSQRLSVDYTQAGDAVEATQLHIDLS